MAGSKKKKNALSLLALLLAVCLMIVAYILLIGHKKEEEAKKAEEEAAAETSQSISLTEFDSTEVTELHVVNSTYEFTIVPKDETWVMKGEEAFPLDQDIAGSLINVISNLTATQEVTGSTTDLEEYGLQTPEIKVTAVKKDGTNVVLNIGDKLTTDSSFYGSIEGDSKVYILPTSTHAEYAKEREELMDIEASPSITSTLIKGLKVESEQYDDFTLLYDEDNPLDFSGNALYPWYLKDTYNEDLCADTTNVTTLLENYTTMDVSKAVDYVKENLENYGLKDPKNAVTVWYAEEEGGEQKEFTIFIGNQDEEGNYYVRTGDSDRTYTMASATIEKMLNVDVFSLVSKFTNLVGVSTIDGFKVTMGSEEYSYKVEHKKETGTDGTESTSEVFYVGDKLYEDEDSFRQYYQQLIALSATGILPEDAAITGEPVLSIAFDRTDISDDFIVEFLPYEEDTYAVRINGSMIFSIDIQQVNAMIEAVRSFK